MFKILKKRNSMSKIILKRKNLTVCSIVRLNFTLMKWGVNDFFSRWCSRAFRALSWTSSRNVRSSGCRLEPELSTLISEASSERKKQRLVNYKFLIFASFTNLSVKVVTGITYFMIKKSFDSSQHFLALPSIHSQI